jgi:hypothetical protein
MPMYEVEIEHRDTDQVFSYWHGDVMLHFNATLLGRLRKAMPNEFRRITMDITEAEYSMCMSHRGIEEPRVNSLRPSELREPGMGVLFDDDHSFTIVDGHHRLVRRYRGGVRVMDFWVTYEAVWRHCLVEYTAEGERMLADAMPPKVENPVSIPSSVTVHKHNSNKDDE